MLVTTIWPIFAIICLGFTMARSGFPGPSFWPAAERVNYFILFPALLVSSLVNAPVHDPAIYRLGGAALVTIGVAASALSVFRRFHPIPGSRFGPVMQATIRFNTYLGLAVIASLEGAEGLHRAAVYLAVGVPTVNVLSIIAFNDPGASRDPLGLAKVILRNPLILACIFGLFLALTDIGLPFGSKAFFSLLAQGSLPLGLLCVGAALKPKALGLDAPALVASCAVRLLGMPVLAAVMAWIFGLSGVEALILVVCSAIPTAPTAYVLTQQLKGDGPFMAGLVTAQTMAAVVTIPLVLWALGFS